MIHPNLPGLVVTIDVAEQDLPEYNEDEADDGSSGSCVKYVEAVSGAEFGIAVRFDSTTFPLVNDSISLCYYFDGQSAGKKRYHPADMRQLNRMIKKGALSNTAAGLVSQAMMFSELTINEDKPDSSLFGKLGDLGTITVKAWRVVMEQLPPPKRPMPARNAKGDGRVKNTQKHALPIASTTQPLVPNGQVSEKTLKGQALTHQATLGPPVLLPAAGNSGSQPTTREVRKGEVLATYVFKYRSRAALQALHIIPRTPSPVPLEERPVEELSIDEMRELVARQRAKEASQADREVKQEIKRERGVDDGDIEVVGHVSKKARTSNDIEVVDLCFDD
ncbi:hypothetical protein LTR10_004364 [Elasticomyces elasticus]|nr:hypothetical protein LTR10_004364 [Elasticomyces elasticus]KAK4976683.1 hypothetical protein LTR42_002726 [Elasticomyces elasticus]